MNDQESQFLPLVSIVIPVRNGSNFLEQAIASSIAQDYPNIEIVIGVNPSDDDTISIAKNFASYNNVFVHEFSDLVNMPANFNRTAKLATGSFIKFLCHDDTLPTNSISKLVAAFRENRGASMAVGGESFMNSSRSSRDWRSYGSQNSISGPKIRSRLIRHGNILGGPSAVLFPNACFKIRQFDETLECSFDFEYWLFLARQGRLAIANGVTLNSRVHDKQASSNCERGGFQRDNLEIIAGVIKNDNPWNVMHAILVLRSLKSVRS